MKYHDISECRNLQRNKATNSTNTSQLKTNSRFSNIICYKCNSPGHLASACFQQQVTENDKKHTYDSKSRNSIHESRNPTQINTRRTRNDSENGIMRMFEAETLIEDISDEDNLN